MNREKIDEFLQIFQEGDLLKIKLYLGIDEEKDLDEDFIDKIYKVATDIEQGDYDYFKSKLEDKNYQSLILEFMSFFSSDKNNDKKKIIEERDKYSPSEYVLTELIKSINDPEYTKIIIEENEKYGLSDYHLVDLIKSINDSEYTKKIIEERDRYRLDEYSVSQLVGSINDPEYIIKFIQEEEKLGIVDINSFIESINNPEYIKKIIEEGVKHGLDSDYIYEFIKSINDSEYTKKCIEENEKYGLYKNDIFDLIKSINDPEFTKKCIEENEKYGLPNDYLVDLIKSINDPEYTKKCIEEKEKYGLSNYHLINLIKSINDPEYTKKCIEEKEKYGLPNDYLVDLIKSINDPEYTKKCIEENEKYGLSNYHLINLIKSINDPEYTKKIIEGNKKYGLPNDYLVDLIRFVNNPEYSIKCIKDRKKIGIATYGLSNLIDALGDDENTIMFLLKDYKNLDIDLFTIQEVLNRNADLFFSKFDEIYEIFENEEIYEELISETLGNVELDKNKKPIIQKELRKLFSTQMDSETLKKFKLKLPEIIAKWDMIKDQIQFKRAKNVIDNGLEVRDNIKEILSSLEVLNRRSPQKPSEIELESIPGAENIGQDVQFTSNLGTCIDRAYDIAVKMDNAENQKKFPDFSTEYKDIMLEVIHPQDKSAILLGYETQCCFRPNGNADESGLNENSLFQYCTTTPYGGIIKCKEKGDNKVYMGTPILRNGNMLMFHSYETKNKEKCDDVNIILENAAKKAIELSNGKIKAVFITNLHTGKGYLNDKGKLILNSYFKAYTEEDYKKYEKMYTNLDSSNVVLAINCDGEILTRKSNYRMV